MGHFRGKINLKKFFYVLGSRCRTMARSLSCEYDLTIPEMTHTSQQAFMQSSHSIRVKEGKKRKKHFFFGCPDMQKFSHTGSGKADMAVFLWYLDLSEYATVHMYIRQVTLYKLPETQGYVWLVTLYWCSGWTAWWSRRSRW